MTFYAAPVIRDTRENIGAPAKTDFVRIFICDDVSKREYDVLFKHEQAHIWLEHNHRFVKGMKRHLWDIATEVEIARNIYSEADIKIIKAPFSRISGGFVPDTIPDLPADLVLAEEIYDWLEVNKKESERQSCDCSNKNSECSDKKMHSDAVKNLISDVVKDLAMQSKSEIAEQNTQLNLSEIRVRKPTLVHEIDAALRKRVEREFSYRRPSRRENTDFIHRGRITVSRPPLVEIFVDRSGSFTPEKTAKAQAVLSGVLNKYHSSIRQDVWFFGSGKISARDFSGGDTPYHLIHSHLEKTRSKIAVILTDDDNCCDFERKINVTKILVIPIFCNQTQFAKKIGGLEVSW